LTAPVLHKVLNYDPIQPYIFGGKGVGSQGDGSAQLITKDEKSQQKVIEIIERDLNMSCMKLTIQSNLRIRKAVIPAAGFGTRLFPATKAIKKELFPIIDCEGRAKPVILAIIEEALSAGIEEIGIIIQSNDREIFEDFLHTPPRIENFNKLSKTDQKYCEYLLDIGHKINFINQDIQEGFGHAVFCAKEWVGNEPFLLLLGDHLYESKNDVSCVQQLIDVYEQFNKSVVGLEISPAEEIHNFGCVTGKWHEKDSILSVTEITEKPEIEYAHEHLHVEGMEENNYLKLFGLYILKPLIFVYLEEHIAHNIREKGEFQLTSCIDRLRQEDGLTGYLVDGRCYDIGYPESYLNTLFNFKNRENRYNLESIGILTGGIAHDFNNILAAILGNISLAKISIDDKNEVIELLKEAEKVSLHAKDLTQQLLTFSKGSSPIKETTELIELIKNSARFTLRGSNVRYRSSIAPDLWTADVDKGQIKQVLGSLIINAQQAMPEGGTINITAENVTLTTEDNLPLQEGKYVKISIIDKGAGIPDDHLSNIFDPYFTTKQKGSGFGLTTAYSIIKRHDGHITVASELGVGTTFHIYLPASSIQVEKKVEIIKEPVIIKGKILLMDDEQDIRMIVSKTLTRSGSVVEVASDGAEAIDLYKKAMVSSKPFDAVILDLTIPEAMGGKEAIKKLLEIDPDVKAVVSSGYSDDPAISNFKEYGFVDSISKPYKFKELIEVLNKVMTIEFE